MSVWEVERDHSDGQYDLLQDGRVVAAALHDLWDVAGHLRSEGAPPEDVIEVAGQVMSISGFMSRYG